MVDLTSADRCDGCGAQAWVKVWFEAGELLLCGHHWGVHEARFRALDALWDDQRDRINANLDVSA